MHYWCHLCMSFAKFSQASSVWTLFVYNLKEYGLTRYTVSNNNFVINQQINKFYNYELANDNRVTN